MPMAMIAPAGVNGTKVVPEWVKELSAEGPSHVEAERLVARGYRDVKPHNVAYWRTRARMFSKHSIFANEMLWGALREAILDVLSPWEPKPWGRLVPDVTDIYGHVSEGTMRHALRMLVEDGVLQFTEPGDDENGEYSYGGYTRERHPIRRSCDLDFDKRDRITKRDRERFERRYGATACL